MTALFLSRAAAAETAATATAWRESDAHALDGIAPLREAQLAVGTDLERIGRARCQVVHRSCLLRTRNGRGKKRGGRCTTCPKRDRKSTRLNSSHSQISYAVFCLKKKKTPKYLTITLCV